MVNCEACRISQTRPGVYNGTCKACKWSMMLLATKIAPTRLYPDARN